MKHNLTHKLHRVLLCILVFTGCKKTTDTQSSNAPANTTAVRNDSSMTAVNTTIHPYPVTRVQDCIYNPNYGDSIVYPQPASGNFYIYPQNTQGIQGTYLSWPGGLVLDSVTGVINLTQSQTGERYDIAFVQYGTRDTCISGLIVAGTAYMDSVYVLNQNKVTAAPYFNANITAPSPCQNNNNNGNGNGCQFDYTHTAKKLGVEIDNETGIIDIQKSVKKIFGKNPVNGSTANVTIFYTLNDNSNNAPQQIPLQFVYYNHRSDIPAAVLATITNRNAGALNNQLLSKGAKSRPPLIIIVRAN